MATWASTTQTSSFDAEQFARNSIESRHSSRSFASVSEDFGQKSFLGIQYGGQSAQSLSGYSVVGINAEKIPEMREAIRTAVSALQGHIDGIEAHTNSSMAFKSEDVKVAVENYVVAVKDYCKALISDLLAFSDKLQTVHDAWIGSTSTYATDSIEGSKGTLTDNANYYTEKF